MINTFDTPTIFNQLPIIIYYTYPIRLFIASICVLFWYAMCCMLKREIKKDGKEPKNILWRLIK